MAEHAINRLYMDTEDKPVILIADDSRVVRVSLKNILKNDCHLIEAEDGQQAWEMLLEHPHVQLIFSDLSMPRLDGKALLDKVRQSEITRIKNLPFIVVTGNEDDAQSRNQLLENGATEIVTKPFETAKIVTLTKTLISQQESESVFILPDESLESDLLPDTAGQSDFMQVASKELSFAIRNKNELAIALLKIDQYDDLDSQYSEHAIEHILMNLAEIVRQHIHPDDTMGYFGNGLYAILRPASNAIGTRYIGRRILEGLALKQFSLGDSDEIVSASMGISAPEIKPGTRLRELLLLAESRLKSAIDLGGNRVIDKGNETLQPVDTSSDQSQEQTTLHTSFLDNSFLNDSSGSQNLRSELNVSASRQTQAKASGSDSQQVTDLQRQISLLIKENQDLQAQVLRWHGQSGESEQLRQRVFELESEQQQMQIKLSELHSSNQDLQQRLKQSEDENRQLIEHSQEQNVTLEQANQFYEEENQRLQTQLNSLTERTQKAEAAFKEAQQQNTGQRNNITQLREQLEQVQQQLISAQQQVLERQSQTEQHAEPETNSDQEYSNNDSSILEPPSESELLFNGFPSTDSSPRFKDPDTELLAEKEKKASEERKPETSVLNPESISIPVYRTEPEKLPKERRPLSSFAIASIILILLLGLGGGYFYNYFQQPDGAVEITDSTKPAEKARAKTATTGIAKADEIIRSQKAVAALNSQPIERNSNNIAQAKKASNGVTDTSSSPTKVAPGEPSSAMRSEIDQSSVTLSEEDASIGDEAASEEARLEAELMLRQMAEEEFNQKLRKIGTTNPTAGDVEFSRQTDPGTPAQAAESLD